MLIIKNGLLNLKFEFSKEADEKEQLYGSISKKEIIKFLKDNDIVIHSDDIIMKNSIRTLGLHEIIISPYMSISHVVNIKVNKNWRNLFFIHIIKKILTS